MAHSTPTNPKILSISSNNFAATLSIAKQAKYPGQHILWTDDFRVELPIRMGE
jgi:hypothetical protein